MKLCTLPVAFSLALSASAAALPQEAAWDFTYDYAPRPGFFPVALEPTPDGGFVMAGIARDFPHHLVSSASNVVIAKFTENGDRTWVVNRSLPQSFQSFNGAVTVDVDVDPDGNVYVIEPRDANSRLSRYQPNGTLAWTVPVGVQSSQSYFEVISHVDASVPGEVVVAGGHLMSVQYPFSQLQFYGPDGALLFSDPAVPVLSATPHWVFDMVRGPSGEIFLTGVADTYSPGNRIARVRKYDANGAAAWLWAESILGAFIEVADVAAAPLGVTTIISSVSVVDEEPGSLLLTRVDSSGLNIFQRSFVPIPGSEVKAESLALLPGGGFVVAGSLQRSGPSNRSFAVMYFDATGQATAVSYLPNVPVQAAGSAEHVILDSDGNVLVLGWSEGDAQEGVLASFDQAGNSLWVERIEGSRPLPTQTSSTSSALGMDVRGNTFSITQDVVSGSAPTQDLGIRLRKTVRGGDVGASFCGPAVPNSTGAPATIRVLGLSEATDDNVSLVASDLPGGVFTLFIGSQMAGNVPGAGGGQGTLCLSGPIGRYLGPGQVRRASQEGDASLQIELTEVPQPSGFVQATAGQTWRFQAWHRDANPGVTSNFTNGVSLLLQ